MCGIVGVFHSGGRLPDAAVFDRCVQRLWRRGPDDSGQWNDALVRLGHRRLAIVDLSANGHQPMESRDGRFVIVFNGEIYNHAELRPELTPPGGWRGTSDTETLLEAYRAWGVECLQHLNGMFAFAIWDRAERRLFVARDRMGVKPLYYGWRNGAFAFASRPGALTGLLGEGSGEIDAEALRIYLELGYIPAPLSFYRHVHKLRAGHYMLFDSREPRAVRYWDYRHIPPDPALLERHEEDLIDELEELIRRSVKSRLMSDVPLGAFLSGGVDSATVVAAMKAVGVSDPRTFTITFAEEAYNEGPAAARIAAHLGVDHTTESLHVGDLLGLLPLYVDEFDEPFADSSAFPTMAVAKLARRHVTVALTGDAGDELFGGYHYYSLVERLALTHRWPRPAKRLLHAVAARLPSHKAKLVAGALQRDTSVGVFNYVRGCGKDFPPLVTSAVLQETQSSLSWFEQAAASFALDLTGAEQGMRLDLGFMLADGYLQKVDVATMAMSLEARCPLIDYRLVEWAMRLPVRYKIRGGETKYLLKKALCRHLPPQLIYRPKQGFGVPVAQWLRGPLRSWTYDLVTDDSLVTRLPLDRARLISLVDLHMSGARDAHPVLWALLMLLSFVARHDRGMELPARDRRHAA
ncbi:MAG TPA: asparagine synthase (glutamine-hydrolyzing) [Steroidobacteraceae bacterium]|nr:asparagine synthase (glutamine-hydrolyzing) [Steroidobacteraceae bacterium]